MNPLASTQELEGQDEAAALESLLAGASDQAALEKSLEKKLEEDLRRRDNDNDEKRIRKTKEKLRAQKLELDALHDQLAKPNLKISTKSAILGKVSGVEERIEALNAELRDIELRIHQRIGTDGGTEFSKRSSNWKKMKGENAAEGSERDQLIRTGKITPFDAAGVAENFARTNVGRSMKAVAEERLEKARQKSRKVMDVPQAATNEDFERQSMFHSDDDTVERNIPTSKRRKIRRKSVDSDYLDSLETPKLEREWHGPEFEDEEVGDDELELESGDAEFADDGDEYCYLRRYERWVHTRKLERKAKKECGDAGDDETEGDSIANEPFIPLPNDLKLSNNLVFPGDVASKLFPYQLTTLSWLSELYSQQVGGILGDEMGLGKTVQIVAFLAGLHRSRRLIPGHPILVVAPATVLRQWTKEFHDWWGAMRIVILHSSGSGVSSTKPSSSKNRRTYGLDEGISSDDEHFERTGSGKSFKKPDRKVSQQITALVNRVVTDGHVLITTYEGVRVYRDVLLPIRWGYVVLDEGHKIRNADAEITIVCKKLKTPHRLILSGTPIQNNLKELWSLYDFVYPGRLGTLPVFLTQFEVPIRLGAYANASNLQVQTAQRCAIVLRDLISPYLLRRMKCDVASDLPQKTESVLFCKLTQEQRKLYEEYISSDIVRGVLSGRRNALGAIDGVRKICNHPDLLHRDEKLSVPDYGSPSRSGKMQVVKALLSMWQKQGHRALIFCQTRQMQEILELFLKDEGHSYYRMDGMTPIKHRMSMVDKFNSDPSIFLFLLTTKVGGLGINLTGANRVLIYDPDWNPSTDVQARERAWRVGQTRDVAVYRLMMSGTIEEKIYHRQIYKQFMTNKILSDPSGGGGSHKRFFDSRSMKDLFQLGDADCLGTETGSLFEGTEIVKKSDIQKSAKAHSTQAKREKSIPKDLIPLGKGRLVNDDTKSNELEDIPDIARVEDFEDKNDKERTVAEGQEVDEDSRVLFSLLHSTVAHDKVMNVDSTAIDPLTRAEADRVAREAADEVRRSRKRIRAAQMKGGVFAGVVTFTGHSGSAGRQAASTPVTPPERRIFGANAGTSRGDGASSASLLAGLRNKFLT